MSSAAIDDRFEIISLAGEGGMGRVYRARDVRDGTVVALKILRDEVHTEETVSRFRREIHALAQLDDPAIVRHVAHGTTRDGNAYLAMQWIDGEELLLRLRRGTLTVEETLIVASRVAGALAHAHARGVIHRDVKPANIILPDEVLAKAMLIDFGLARTEDHEVTHAGILLGTPTYMAPEQARGHNVGPAVDTFALGCVMAHCLTGHSPFAAKGATAVLARVLFEEAPRIDNVPAPLADLIASMLRKAPAERPSMSVVLDAVTRMRTSFSARPPPILAAEALGVREQRIVSVVVTGSPSTSDEDDTLRWVAGARQGDAARTQAIAERFGAQSMLLPNGSFLVVLSTNGSATDLAVRAADLGLSLQRELRVPVSVATGRAEVSSGIPVGEAVDRAVSLEPFAGDGIRVDNVTSGLLDDRFAQDGSVVRKRRALGPLRTLLGKPTPCVGRDAELGMLEGVLAHCLQESAARTVLVTAPAGVGKSRLRHEFLRRVAARDDGTEIWTARGDSAGSAPFGMIAQMVRQTCGILEGEPVDESRAKLRARVRVPRVVAFLGEIIGVDAAARDDIQVAAARRDAMLMAEQMRRAFTDLLEVETRDRPLVIVLEDLHWGDVPTVSALDHALRLFAERPILVLAFARPEVRDTFPNLFAERSLQPIPLGPLPKRAAERLVQHALPSAGDAASRLVEQAAGNVFYLEELIRATAEGRDATVTVVAMVQSRLSALDARARRVLRAASVFGETFWEDSVRTLLGGEDANDTRRTLAFLVENELCARRQSSRLAHQTEYAFRHGLVREGAYAMLTTEDARLGHRLAAEWLERAGETSAAALADNYARGGEPARAAELFLRAAQHSLESNDLAAAIELAERGVVCGATGALRGSLRVVQAQAHLWRNETEAMDKAAAEAIALLPPQTSMWADALIALAVAKQRQGRVDELVSVAAQLGDTPPSDERSRAYVARAAARISVLLLFAGRQDLGSRTLAFAERAAQGLGMEVQARIHHAHAPRARQAGRQAEALEHLSSAEAAFRAVGDEPNAALMMNNRGFSLSELGAYREALPVLESTLELAVRLGLSTVAANAQSNLAMVHLRLGDVARAEQIARAALKGFQLRDRRQEGITLLYLSIVLLESGKSAIAEGEARAALDLLEAAPPLRPYAAAVLASSLLAMERDDEALSVAREGADWLDAGRKIEEGEAFVRLTHARALLATGDRASARQRILEARDRLQERADEISNPELRRSFLERVPEHVATLELAREL